jgi:hypothetical protein
MRDASVTTTYQFHELRMRMNAAHVRPAKLVTQSKLLDDRSAGLSRVIGVEHERERSWKAFDIDHV